MYSRLVAMRRSLTLLSVEKIGKYFPCLDRSVAVYLDLFAGRPIHSINRPRPGFGGNVGQGLWDRFWIGNRQTKESSRDLDGGPLSEGEANAL